jgi:excisionase family DNA binding protein
VQIWNVKQVSEYLGRSESAVRNMCSRRQIPHRIVGGRRLCFIQDEINEWIMNAPGTKLNELEGLK